MNRIVTADDMQAAWKRVPARDLLKYATFPIVIVDLNTRRIAAGARSEEDAEKIVLTLPRSRYFTSDNPKCPGSTPARGR